MGAPTPVIDAPARTRTAGLRERLARVLPAAPPDRPWYVRLEAWTGVAVVGACVLFLLFQLQPHLLLRNTTTAGGDTGAHVWWPAYLRDHVLPNWRLAGWSRDFYAGFPAGQFYFPLPALLIVALDVFLPYNVAFKLITALGPLLLPVGAYVFGRGLRFPRPAPALMAVSATAFLFFTGRPGTSTAATSEAFNQRIMGGTLASNLAGEFSFTLALAFGLMFLGALGWTLDHREERRRRSWLPAVLLAATVLSHLVVGVFAALAALVVWLAHRPVRTYNVALAIGAVGALLTAVWSLPLLATLGYTTDMGYETLDHYIDYLFPTYFWYLYVPAAVALVVAVIKRRWSTLQLAAITGLLALVFRLWDVFDTPAWNLRFLPFWYLGLFLLAAVGVAEIVRGIAAFAVLTVKDDWWRASDEEEKADEEEADESVAAPEAPPARRGPSLAMVRSLTVVSLTVALAFVGLLRLHQTRDFLDYWIRYNYTGYERADYLVEPTGKSSDEYFGLVETLDELPPGRLLWENDSPALGAYGTALALMLLPYWTDGRIGSMEGLYYEAAASTPYLFLAVATLTTPGKASNPVRGLTYRTIADFDLGVRYLQLMGVRYYMAQSTDAKARADAHPDLELVAEAPDLDGRPRRDGASTKLPTLRSSSR